MTLPVTAGLLLAIVSLSNLVVGDPLSVLTITSTKQTNNPNEYMGTVTHEVVKGKKSSQLNAKLPVTKELPPTMQLKLTVGLAGQDPFEYAIPVCDALTDPTIGSTFVKAGLPKDKFPKACPFGPGDWSISKWDPPVEKIPPGIPDGAVSGSIMVVEEGSAPCFQVDFEGELSHAAPGFGR